MSNRMPGKVWDEIACQFLDFNCCTVVVWEWMGGFISHFVMGVIVCPCWDWSWTVLVKRATGVLSCARSLPHFETRFPRFHGRLVIDGLRNLVWWTEPVRLAKIRFSRALHITWLLNQLPFCCAHEVCELLFVCLFVLFICHAVVPPGTGVGPWGGFIVAGGNRYHHYDDL